MTVKIIDEDGDGIEFEVKGKIVLTLTRKGLIYKNELVKDGGHVLSLMLQFLGLAEDELDAQAQEQVVTHIPTDKIKSVLEKNKNAKKAMLVIQSSPNGQDDSKWTNLFQADIPDWVQGPDVIADLMQGGKVRADGGGLWYRACHVLENPKSIN